VTKGDWEQFFDGHAPQYMDNCFAKNTMAEVDFLLEELALPQGSHILDVGCGTGRHSVELAKRGYKMTGVDLSAGMLAEAGKAAAEAGVDIEFIQCDAMRYTPDRLFDAVICLCEGAFGLLGAGVDPMEHDLAIWRLFSSALKPGGKLVLTTLNAARGFREHSDEAVRRGVFDPVRGIGTCTIECDTPEGKMKIELKERSYTPSELTLLAHVVGLRVENVWGGTAGNWGRRMFDLDEMEIMVIAEKPR
jgi:cyclopropane fatty-acyl-phospholipid synthase-like methyltransferase